MVNNWRSQYTLQRKLDSTGCTWSSTVSGKYSIFFIVEKKYRKKHNKFTQKCTLSYDFKVREEKYILKLIGKTGFQFLVVYCLWLIHILLTLFQIQWILFELYKLNVCKWYCEFFTLKRIEMQSVIGKFKKNI